jgi:hypothetical protein
VQFGVIYHVGISRLIQPEFILLVYRTEVWIHVVKLTLTVLNDY